MTRFKFKDSFLLFIPYFLSLDSFLIFSYKHVFFDEPLAGTRKAGFSIIKGNKIQENIFLILKYLASILTSTRVKYKI